MSNPFDVCIVGAGPAGLQAADSLTAEGLNVIVLERGPTVGTFFRQYPRHRQLISINKVSTGLSDPELKLRFDWNSLLSADGPLFTDVTRRYFPPADAYVGYLEDFATRLDGKIRCDAEVTDVARDAEGFRVTLGDGDVIAAKQVIVATGVSKPWQAEIEGGDLIECYTEFDPTPERFRDKRVLILGKGNSAFETADSLIEEAASIHVMSPNPVKLAWNTHFVGHLRAVNNNFLDTYQLKSQNAMIDARPTRVERGEDGSLVVTADMTAAAGHEIVLHYDHIIACTGFRFDPSIMGEGTTPELRHFDKFPAMGANWESEAAPGLWYAGTIMQCRDFKKTMSGFVHGFRHNVEALCRFVAARAKGEALETDTVALDDLAAEVVDRASTSAAMFLQPGFLGDIVALSGPEAGTRYRDMPVEWAKQNVMTEGDWLTVTLEFGDFGGNPLHVMRKHEAGGENPDPFIHPVLRHWRDGEVVAMTHLTDHLDSDWRSAEARDKGTGTVLRMTFADRGAELPPGQVALEQAGDFLSRQQIGRMTEAAE